MTTTQQIVEEIERLFGLKDMVESYEEIAATRMRRIRDSVLQTRDFLSGINDVFHNVQDSYKRELERLLKHKKVLSKGQLASGQKATFLNRNGKKVFVLLSANTGLYGGIIRKTFNMFLENIKQEQTSSGEGKTDIVVIGKLGKAMFEDERINIHAAFFDFPDNKIDYDIFKKIMEHVLQYETILVFHGQFQTVITQKPIVTNLSGENLKQSSPNSTPTTSSTSPTSPIRYLFEPSLEKTMAFFEKEIFSSIFEQTLHESELSKFSSRMVVLDQAVDNIRGRISKVEIQKRRLKHSKENKKQLSRLSGMSLWRQ